MKIRKTCQILGLLVLVGIIFLTGCRSGGGGGGNGGGGGGGGSTTSTVIFKLPEYYEGVEEEGSFAIPEGKEVRFYTSSNMDIGISVIELLYGSVPEDDQTFLADYYFAGKTGDGEIKSIIPNSLISKGRYIYAAIFLENGFDPQEKSVKEILEAVAEGKILFGFARDPNNELPKVYALNHGVTIKDFIFIGKSEGDPIYTLTFSLPPTYQDFEGKSYEVPEGKTVKFYAAVTPAGEEGTVEADHVFTGTTGDSIICEIPSHLLREERYFYAVVCLEGDFDLQGKNKDETLAAIEAGEILFGQAGDEEGNMELYYLVHGTRIDNFKLRGKGVGNPITTITIKMPSHYEGVEQVDREDEEEEDIKFYQIPKGKKVKFYVPPEPQADVDPYPDDIFSPDYTFPERTTGPATFEFELPPSLVGIERDIIGMVVLEGDFDLDGETLEKIDQAYAEGKILMGFSEEYILNYGITIEMVFNGTPPEE